MTTATRFDTISMFLETLAFSIFTAYDGQAAVDMILDCRPDAAVVMRDISGYEVG